MSRTRAARRAGRLLLMLPAAGLVLWLAGLGLVVVAGQWPSRHDADVILVLGAAQWNGRPSPVLRARVDHALSLYADGRAPRLIFTGGVGAGDTLSEAEVSRQYALQHGVPDSVIAVELGVTSQESVTAAAARMHAHGLRTALVVSDSYHMLRLEVLARRAGIRPYRAPAANAPIDLARRQTRWRYVLRESVLFPATVVLGGR